MIDGTLGFVFPGQGSQSTAMLADLYEAYPLFRQTFVEASERLGFDLWALVRDNPADALDQTQHTQPALLTCSVAIWRLWRQRGGVLPGVVAGHSLGEYSALVCAEVLTFGDAVVLVAERGKYMQEAVPASVGAMAAILGLGDGEVEALCRDAAGTQVVSAANFNAEGQVVIAGHREAVERAADLARQAGAKRAILLAVSVPSHCALMKEAAGRFSARLAEANFSTAAIPVIQNVDATARRAADDIKQALVQQLHQPVRWSQCVAAMREAGVSTVIESGPGKVLAGLIRRIDRSLTVLSVFDLASFDVALNTGGGNACT